MPGGALTSRPGSGMENNPEAAGGGAAEAVTASLPLAPILVADDEEDVLGLFPRFLQKLRLANPLELARDGEEVLAYLTRVQRGEAPSPVLVVLDLHMPRKTGLDVLRAMRERSELRDLPVVMLTGSAAMDEVQECHTLGVESYLVKPVGFAALSDVLRGLDSPWAFLASDG